MNKCLLCNNAIQFNPKFCDLLFLQTDSSPLCSECRKQFETIETPFCSRCQKGGVEKICQDCLEWERKGEVVHHRAIYHYNKAMKEYFRNYKFWKDYRLRECFREELSKRLKEYKDFTIIVIPISEERQKERGFNQVSSLLDAANIDYLDILKKREVEKQSHLSRQDRMQRSNVFYCEESSLPDRILLFDDIYTTGTTLHQAKETLLKIESKEIKTFSLCR